MSATARIRLPDSTDSLRTSYKYQLPEALQPKFTWRYCLASATVAYFAYCLLFDSPFFSSNLPPYTGPYDVGALDIEVPVRQPRLIDEAIFKSNNEPAFKLETVLFTVYYPASEGVKSGKHHYWVPKPLWLTAVGYAKVAHISNFLTNNLFTGIMGLLVGGRKIPAEVGVPLIAERDLVHGRESQSASMSELDETQAGKSVGGLPIIIFTHGMASTRTQYSHYLGELSSRGYICAAIEHRDGSGPGTQIINSASTSPIVDKLHFGINDVKRSTKSEEKIEADEFKRIQLAFREAEILETTHLIHSLHEGSGDKILAANSREEGAHADLANWKGRLNTSATILAGHSYGATGALQGLKQHTDMARIFAAGIALDPGKSSGRLNADVEVPLLIVHSSSWSAKRSVFYGRPHFETVREIALGLNKRGIGAWFMTSLGTSHPSVTDAPLLEPLLLKWTTGATIDAREGIRQYVHASSDFGTFVTTGEKVNLLALPANSPDYNPDNKGMNQKWKKYWQIHVSPVTS